VRVLKLSSSDLRFSVTSRRGGRGSQAGRETRQTRTSAELILIAAAALAALLLRELLPGHLSLGSAVPASAGLLFAQGLLRDLWLRLRVPASQACASRRTTEASCFGSLARMTPRQLESIRIALLALRAQAVGTGRARIEPNQKDETQVGVSDEDAQALSEMLQVLNSQRNKGQAELIARIDRALGKVSSNPAEVGVCEECEEQIPLKRLRLMPYALLCAQCQTKKDPQRGGARKSVRDFD